MKLDELVLFYKNFLKEEALLRETFLKWSEIVPDQGFIFRFVDSVLDISKSNISTKKRNAQADLMNSIEVEMVAMGNNGYGLFNGLAHYTTHKIKANKEFGNAFGRSSNLNRIGFDHLRRNSG